MQKTPLINIKHLHISVFPGNHPAAQDLAVSPILSTRNTSSDLPKIGEIFEEQGGIFAGIIPAQDGHPAYGLILPTDPAAEAEQELAWGGYNRTVDGANSSWDGKANTEALLKDNTEHTAAKFCAAVKIGNHNDFYLASRRESSLMAATVPHLFKEGWHWTSTQYSAYHAYVQDFSDGTQSSSTKVSTRRVRAVRRFIIH